MLLLFCSSNAIAKYFSEFGHAIWIIRQNGNVVCNCECIKPGPSGSLAVWSSSNIGIAVCVWHFRPPRRLISFVRFQKYLRALWMVFRCSVQWVYVASIHDCIFNGQRKIAGDNINYQCRTHTTIRQCKQFFFSLAIEFLMQPNKTLDIGDKCNCCYCTVKINKSLRVNSVVQLPAEPN